MHALNQSENLEQHYSEWVRLLENLGISTNRHSARTNDLEHYLDRNEAFIEDWAERSGA